jgi:hypothetical protein
VDANNVSSLLGGSKKGERGKPDTVSRDRMVTAVLEFTEASNSFKVARHEGRLTMGAAIGLDEALSSFLGSGTSYMYRHGYT